MLEPVLLRVVTVVIATLQVMYVVQFKVQTLSDGDVRSKLRKSVQIKF